MTVLVLNNGKCDIATQAWTAWSNDDGATSVCFVWYPETEGWDFNIPFTEFLALIADGGKIVDLRKLQSAETIGEGKV